MFVFGVLMCTPKSIHAAVLYNIIGYFPTSLIHVDEKKVHVSKYILILFSVQIQFGSSSIDCSQNFFRKLQIDVSYLYQIHCVCFSCTKLLFTFYVAIARQQPAIHPLERLLGTSRPSDMTILRGHCDILLTTHIDRYSVTRVSCNSIRLHILHTTSLIDKDI